MPEICDFPCDDFLKSLNGKEVKNETITCNLCAKNKILPREVIIFALELRRNTLLLGGAMAVDSTSMLLVGEVKRQ